MAKRNRKNVKTDAPVTEEQVNVPVNFDEVQAANNPVETEHEEPKTESNNDPFKDVPEPEQDIVDPDPKHAEKKTRRAAITENSVITVLYTENPQRAGTKSYNYNKILQTGQTVKEAMELGVPRHHINYLAKEGHISAS